jgi:hypothetical protein
MPAAKGGRLDVRLPARQWGERVAIGIPGGHGVEIRTQCLSRIHGTPFLYRLNAGQRKGTSDRKGWQGQPTWVYFPQGAVLSRRRPMSLTLHLSMGGDQSSHSAKRNPMQIPVWLKPGLWGAASGAVVMAIVGFSQLGWKTEGSAEQLAQERADTAVVAALVPFCVAKAQMDTQQTALASFQAEQSSYSRSDLVVKAGWATLGIAKSPDSSLARACSAKLYGMKSG